MNLGFFECHSCCTHHLEVLQTDKFLLDRHKKFGFRARLASHSSRGSSRYASLLFHTPFFSHMGQNSSTIFKIVGLERKKHFFSHAVVEH